MEIESDTAERYYAEQLQTIVPHLAHAGQSHTIQAGGPIPPHVHPGVLEIIHVASGQVFYDVNGKGFTVKGGDLFLNFPGEMHSTGARPEERMTFYWIGIDITSQSRGFLGFNDSEACQLRQALRALKTRLFRGNHLIKNSFDRFFETLVANKPCNLLLLRCTLVELLYNVVAAEKTSQPRRISRIIANSLKTIESQLTEKITLQVLADAAHMSLSHYQLLFRREMGMPPYEYILRRKIERAQEQLATTTASITEIAFSLGFPSSQHFATLFKKLTNLTPTAYRSLPEHN